MIKEKLEKEEFEKEEFELVDIEEKWYNNVYELANGYKQLDADKELTEKQMKTVLRHIQLISDAYVSLYEEKK